MNRFYINLIVFLLFSTTIMAQPSIGQNPNDTVNYPHWTELIQNQQVNFYTTKAAFNQYWSNKSHQKGDGWKVYKRWENYWSTRVDVNGNFPSPTKNIDAYNQFFNGPVASSSGSWTSIGPTPLPTNGTGQPNGLGRVNAIAFHPTNSSTIYIGAPSGGLWRTENGGTSWTPLTDNLPSLGVSAIVVDYSNANTIYLGTGDRDAGDAPGIGVYKSTNGGTSFTASNTGMGNVTVNALIQDPSSSTTLYAATSSGIYKTTNSGSSWALVSSVSGNYKDIRFKPTTSSTIYAVRNGYFYYSTNSGSNWTAATGLPTSGRFVIGVSSNSTTTVYVAVGSSSGFTGLYKSTNSGASFSLVSNSPNIMGYEFDGSDNSSQAFYDMCIAVDPANVNTVYIGGINIWKSTNGGASWTLNAHWVGDGGADDVHADQHVLEFSPLNSRLYNGNDGGVYYTANGGTTWNDISSGLSIAQIYKLGQSATSSNLLINGYQDNGTAIRHGSAWFTEIGGDGMECLIDPADTNYIYGSLYYGDIRRSSNGGSSFTQIAGESVGGITESGGWVTPYTLQANVSTTMFAGYVNVWRSTNVKSGSPTWTKISNFSTSTELTEIESCPANNSILYVSTGSTLYRTDNATATTPTWVSYSLAATITDIETSPTDQNIVYVTTNSGVYKSTNKGASFTSIVSNLPSTNFNCIVLNTQTTEDLYLGTDIGVFYRGTGTSSWVAFSTGMPVSAEVTELEIYYASTAANSRIKASTFGRGNWSSDLYTNPLAPPVADFEASETSACQGASVLFTDMSTNTPTAWSWTFTPSTVTYMNSTSSTSQNPLVRFNSSGTYTARLITSNSYGSDTALKTSYITVGTPYTAPAIENFEGFTVGNPGTWVNGWTYYNSGSFNWRANNGATPTATSGPNVDHTVGTSSGKYIYTEASSPAASGEVAYAISPCVYLSNSSMVLSFWYHMYGSDITGLHVDILHNGTWVNDVYTLTGQQQTSNGAAWQQASISLASYASSTIKVRFRVIMGASFNGDVAIDDVSIAQPGLPVADFTSSTTNTYSGVPITFADISSNTPTTWAWSFSPSTVTYQTGYTSASQNPIVKFNAPGTYSVTLTASNSTGSNSITKTNYITVNAATAIPYSETFESFTTGTPGILGNGWSRYSSSTSAPFNWTVAAGGTPSTLTGPTVDHTFGTSSGKFLFTEASGVASGTEAILYTPYLNLSSSTAQVSFWYHMYGAMVTSLNLDVFYNNSWITVHTITGQQQTSESASWLQATINLNSFVGNTLQFRFRVMANGDYQNDISIDDVVFGPVPGAVNDEPCQATSIAIGANTCTYTTFTNLNATLSTSAPAPGCGGTVAPDVWFKAVVPPGGQVSIDAEQVTGSFADGVMAAYVGSCSNLTLISCNDDYNGSGNMPHLELTGLTPGDTLFLRFWCYSGAYSGDFQLCMSEPLYLVSNPQTINVSSTYGTTPVSVLSNTTWAVTDNASWLTLSASSGSGNSTLTATYSTNTGANRTATVTFTPAGANPVNVYITQFSSVNAEFTPNNGYLCLGNSSVFTNTSVNHTSSIWYVDGVQVATTNNLSYTFSTSGMHNVKLKVFNGSLNDSVIYSYFVGSTPIANAGTDNSVCAGSSVSLNGTGIGNIKCVSNCTFPTYCPSASGNDGMEYITNVSFNGFSNPSSNLGAGYEDFTSFLSSVLYIDSSYTLSVTGTIPGTAPYLEYIDAFIDFNRNGLFDEPAVSLGSYNFYGNQLFTGLIYVPSTAVLGKTKMRIIMKYASSIASGCENAYAYGETEDYMIEIMKRGETSFLWSGPSSFSSTLDTVVVNNILTSQSGTYTLTVTDGLGCNATDTKLVTVNPIPTVTFSSLNPACVNGALVTLSQGSPSGGTYFGTGVTGNIFNPATAGVGTHTIGYKYFNTSGCGDTAYQTITVNPLPTVTFTSPGSYCTNSPSFTLTGGSPTGGTYSGNGVSAGIFNPTTAGVGTHIVTYTYQNSNGCSNSMSANIVVNSLPTVSFTSPGTYCSNSPSVSLSGGSPSGGTYSGNGVSGNVFNPQTAGVGTHAITYTYQTSSGCSNSAIANITVNPAPTVSFASPGSFCVNTPSFVLTGGMPVGGNYSGAGVSSGSFNPLLAGTGTHSITYTYQNSYGCSNSASANITVNALPTVSFSSPGSYCSNSPSFVLSGGSPVGGSYSGTGVTNGTFNPQTAGVGTHSITYTYQNSNNCTNTASANIIVNSLPTVNAGIDKTISYNTTTTLTGFVSGGISFNYLWTPASKVVNSTSLSTQTIALQASQLFNLKATNDLTGCYDSDDIMVTVVGGPVGVSISAPSANTICQGETTTIQSITSGGVSQINVSWSSSPAGYSSTSPTINVAPSVSTWYKVVATDGNTSATDSVFITVLPKPTVTFTSLAPSCFNSSSVVLTGGFPSGGVFTGTGVSNGVFNPALAGVGVHSIKYTYTDANNCSNFANSNMTVNSVPNATLQNQPSTCLSTTSLQLTGGSPSGGYFIGNNVNLGTFSPSIAGVGSHQIGYVYVDGNGCSDTAFKNLNVVSNPLANAGSDAIIGYNSTTSLSGSASGGSGSYSYSWSPANKVVNPIAAVTTSTALTSTTLFNLTVTDIATQCTDDDDKLVTVTGGALSSNLVANSTSVCFGEDVTVNALISGGTGNYSYSWTSIPSGFSSTSGSFTTIPTVTTDYIVNVVDGSLTISDTISIIVNAQPFVSLGADTMLCGNQALSLNAGSGFSSYLWSNGSQQSTINISGGSLNTGVHIFSVLVSNGVGCNASDTIVVYKDNAPYVNLGPDKTLCYWSSVILDAGFGASSYQWSSGETTQTSVQYGYTLGLGEHHVWAMVGSLHGCLAADTMKVTVENCPGFEDIDNNILVNIYPNPAVSQLNIVVAGESAGLVSIELFSIDGKLVRRESFEFDGGEKTTSIQLSSLSAGVYIVKITGENININKQVIIER